jgi:ribosome-associated protein
MSVISPASLSLEERVCQFLDQHKAENIVTINLRGKADFADSMIIVSGNSGLFLKVLAEKLKEFLHQCGIHKVSIEGLTACDWILVDGQDVIIHLFRPDTRELYNLEKMWSADIQPTLTVVG